MWIYAIKHLMPSKGISYRVYVTLRYSLLSTIHYFTSSLLNVEKINVLFKNINTLKKFNPYKTYMGKSAGFCLH